MIRLLEYEGKALLRQRGVATPLGWLHGEPAATGSGPWVVKAQVLSGGRGKAGGIKFAEHLDDIDALAKDISTLTINGLPVRSVYVEEKIDVAREFYLSVSLDRDRGRPLILACAQGGVDIESVAHDLIFEAEVDPLIGLRPYTVEAVVRALTDDRGLQSELAKIVRRVYEMLIEEDAELIEINPLIVDQAGTVIAADAKIVLDEDAAFRHEGRAVKPDGTAFEMVARELEVIGIELDGRVAAMMNGAGMTMATLDQLSSWEADLCCLVELHGVMWRGPAHIAKVIELMLSLKPRVLFFNIYFQFRDLDIIAQGILQAVANAKDGELPPIVIRMRGVNEDSATAMLKPLGCFITGDFSEACRHVVALAA